MLDTAMSNAYRLALVEAERETGLARATLPASCPYLFQDAMRPDFWPG